MVNIQPPAREELFSFHLAKLPISKIPSFLFTQSQNQQQGGLLHSESLVTMNLGESIVGAQRYNLTSIAFFAWWSETRFLNEFLDRPENSYLSEGWHVRLKLYRRWGEMSELQKAYVDPSLARRESPVVAVTLARLKLTEAARFVRWGKPVERQVRDHSGQSLALAAIRPLTTFSTFSIWQNEEQMLSMVYGVKGSGEGRSHQRAMRERSRKDFHRQFTTLRFVPVGEVGSWKGRSDYTSK